MDFLVDFNNLTHLIILKKPKTEGVENLVIFTLSTNAQI